MLRGDALQLLELRVHAALVHYVLIKRIFLSVRPESYACVDTMRKTVAQHYSVTTHSTSRALSNALLHDNYLTKACSAHHGVQQFVR